jgi:phage shock protein PspC (stress-responsive transcriptional regulator)
MTTNQPLNPDPADHPGSGDPISSESAAPDWGTASSTPPAGSGSDGAPNGSGGSGSGGSGSGGSGSGGTAGGSAGGPSVPPAAGFFDRLRGLGVVRPDRGQGRLVAGVAAGIGRRYGIDPIVVRIAFAALTLFGGFGVLLYGLGWLFLPHPDGRIHAQEVLTGRVTAGFVGALLTVLARRRFGEAQPRRVRALHLLCTGKGQEPGSAEERRRALFVSQRDSRETGAWSRPTPVMASFTLSHTNSAGDPGSGGTYHHSVR